MSLNRTFLALCLIARCLASRVLRVHRLLRYR